MRKIELHFRPMADSPEAALAFRDDLAQLPGGADVHTGILKVFYDIYQEDKRFLEGVVPKHLNSWPRRLHYVACQLTWALEAADGLAYLQDANVLGPDSQGMLQRHSLTFLGDVTNPRNLYQVLREELKQRALAMPLV